MGRGAKMRKKYMMCLCGVVLSLVFVLICYLSRNKRAVNIVPIESVEEKIDIGFMSSWAAYDSKAGRLKKILKNINVKHPMISIQDDSIAGEDFLFSLKTDFVTGNDPDIFCLWPGSDFTLLVEEDKVADLTEILDADPTWKSQFREETWEYVTVNDRIYGLPMEIIYEGLFVNKDLFDQYEVALPTTFEELLVAVERFKEVGIIPIAYNETPEGSYIYQNIIMKLGGKEDIEKPFDEEGHIKTCFIEGMYYMKTLYEKGAFPSELTFMDDKERNDLFINKQAAMIVQGSWFIGDEVLGSKDETTLIIPFPAIKGGKADPTAIIYGCGNGIFHMSEKAAKDPQKRSIGIQLLKELTSRETAKIFVEDSGFISNIKLEESMNEKGMITIKGEELVEGAKELIGPPDSFINRSIWENIIIKQFPSMLRGSKTPEQIFAQVELAAGATSK